MKAKNFQPPPPTETDAKEKLIVYVFEYLKHVGASKAAGLFLEEIRYDKAIEVLNPDEKNAFLSNWWFVFWDLYCAAPEKRTSQPEPTIEGRHFYDYHIANTSPNTNNNALQTSPPQQQQPPHYMGPGGPPQGPPMYGPPMSVGGLMRPMGNRIPQGHGPPPPQLAGPPRGAHFMSGSPRYAPPPHQQMHSGPPPNMQGSSPVPNVMMTMGPGSVPEPCGPSPGMSRMTPGSHVGGGPMPPQMAPGPSPSGSGGQMMSGGPPPINTMPGPGPSPQGRPGPQQGGWQGSVSYGVGSPAGQQCYVQGPPPVQGGSNQPDMGGMMMNDRGMMDVKSSPANGGASTPHQDEFLIPNFNHDNDQSESAEIMKVKQSLQDETKKYEQDKPEFMVDYPDPQNKWNI